MNEERKQWLTRAPNEALSKKLGIVAWVITALVLILVGLMRRPELQIPLPEGVSLSFLPPFHAAVNAVAAVVLVGALISVLMGRIALHRKFILAAMGLSVLFLLSYVAYHFTSSEVKYGDADLDGILSATERAAVAASRPTYLILLISHIVLAGISLPFILFTFIAGWTNRFAAHRKLARWVFPMWLYVAVTGPVCYWMLKPYYL
jgi:putative membrane protein